MTAYTEIHTLTFTKLSKRQLRDGVMRDNMDAILASINTRSLTVRGWSFALVEGTETFFRQNATDVAGFSYLYEIDVTMTWDRADGKTPDRGEADSLYRTFSTRANQPATGKWVLSAVNGEEYAPAAEGEFTKSVDMLEYAPVTLPTGKEWDTAFDHLYGLGSHIGRVRRAAELAVMSNWTMRSHVALVGPPGCGKSDIAHSFKELLGDEAVLEFDGTNMTQAGVVKVLSEVEILPRVIIIEEIEKANEDVLRFLLALLDTRGEIRKVTARATIQRDTKCLCIATVNNVELFRRIMSGALASRFTKPVFFQRPNRETLEMILQREITKLGGDYAWIAPALDYCEEIGEFDPRVVISIALCGREMLLDGTYQEMLRATDEDAKVTDLDF